MTIIGITGTPGAGKGTVVEYLVKHYFKHYSVGDFLKKELEKRNLPANRTNLQNIANELRRKFGSDYIVKKLFTKSKSQKKNVVIESIRNPDEARFIKEHGGILIAVDANQKLRFKRIKLRGSPKDNVAFGEFRRQEEIEVNNSNPSSQNLLACISMADYKIKNNREIEKLYSKIEKIMEKISTQDPLNLENSFC